MMRKPVNDPTCKAGSGCFSDYLLHWYLIISIFSRAFLAEVLCYKGDESHGAGKYTWNSNSATPYALPNFESSN